MHGPNSRARPVALSTGARFAILQSAFACAAAVLAISLSAAAALHFEPLGAFVAFALVAARYSVLAVSAAGARALDGLRRAVERDPTDPERHLALAKCAFARGLYAEAVSAFRTGVALRPDLDLSRPGGVLGAIIARPGTPPGERRLLSRLLTLAIVDMWGEEDGIPAGRQEAGASSPPLDVPASSQAGPCCGGDSRAAWAAGAADLALMSRLRAEAEALCVEIRGLEELRANLGGFLAGEEAEREGEIISREIERLRSRLRMIEGKADAME
jgi:tetratricopeptide (TPR) repeat protein